MPILSRSDKKMPNIKYNEDLEKLTTLTVTQADTKCDKLKHFAKYCKNLKTVIFDNCSAVKYEVLSQLFRSNTKIDKVVFVNCNTFDKDAFESFRYLEKSLTHLDLTGYTISNDEMKSLIRSSLKKLVTVTFGNTCDVTDLFKKYYSHCKIVGLDTKYVSNSRGFVEYTRFGDKDSRMPSSKSDYDLQANQERLRRHESRPKSTNHRDHMVDDDDDYDNYPGKHVASRMAKSGSDKRLNQSLSKSELRVHRSRNYGSSSDDEKYGAQIRYNGTSSSQTSSDDSDNDLNGSPTKKHYEKYERRKKLKKKNMPIFSRSDNKMPNIKYNEDLEKLEMLTVTQADTRYGKLKQYATYCKKLKTVIFDNCSSVEEKVLSQLFRSNPKIDKIVFINCNAFGENAFEAFRYLDKYLTHLDLTGYPISNDELKSLIRSSLKKLELVVFGNTCDVTKIFKEHYPKCKIVGMDTNYVSNSRGYVEYTRFGDKDSNVISMRSDYDLRANEERMRRHELRSKLANRRDHMVSTNASRSDNDLRANGERMSQHELRPKYVSRRDHRVSSNASRMTNSSSDKRLSVHGSRHSDSTDEDKYGARNRYDNTSSSETSSDDSDNDFNRSKKKSYGKYERRK